MSITTQSYTETNCFGCATDNTVGLRLTFDLIEGECFTHFTFGPDYESYPGVIHGGIVATVLDETISQVIHRYQAESTFTVGLRVRYAQPMATGIAHTAVSRITRVDGLLIKAAGTISRDTGELVAAASGSFYRLSEDRLQSMRQTAQERHRDRSQ